MSKQKQAIKYMAKYQALKKAGDLIGGFCETGFSYSKVHLQDEFIKANIELAKQLERRANKYLEKYINLRIDINIKTEDSDFAEYNSGVLNSLKMKQRSIMTHERKWISVNIWDDYCEQETEMFIEFSNISRDSEKKCLEMIIKYIQSNLDIKPVKLNLQWSKDANNCSVHDKWEIKFKFLTHKRREMLVSELENAELKFKDFELSFYSES